MIKKIILFPKLGNFAENKDIARDIRIQEIIPALEKNQEVILDFKNIDAATQSFIHALMSEIIRKYGIEILEKISFQNCSESIQKIITIVTDYMQERE